MTAQLGIVGEDEPLADDRIRGDDGLAPNTIRNVVTPSAKSQAGQDRTVPIVDRLATLLADHAVLMDHPATGFLLPGAWDDTRPLSVAGFATAPPMPGETPACDRSGSTRVATPSPR